MAKIKKGFFCQSCGAQFIKWQGQCSACKEWNTLIEEILAKGTKVEWKSVTEAATATVPKTIESIDLEHLPRILTPDEEFNRVLGGGLVPGAVIFDLNIKDM